MGVWFIMREGMSVGSGGCRYWGPRFKDGVDC